MNSGKLYGKVIRTGSQSQKTVEKRRAALAILAVIFRRRLGAFSEAQRLGACRRLAWRRLAWRRRAW